MNQLLAQGDASFIARRESPVGFLPNRLALGATHTDKQSIANSYGQIPLHFEANQGQTDAEVRFLSRGDGYTLFLTPTEAVLSLRKATKVEQETTPSVAGVEDPGTQTSTVQMKLIGANPTPKITGLEELPGRTNHFVGSDPTKWRTDVPLYSKVQYKDIYPGIDLIYYGNQRQLEYDFMVHPGVDPSTITLSFHGAKALEVDAHGDLVLHTGDEPVRFKKPLLYQSVDRGPTGNRWGLSARGQTSSELRRRPL